MTKTSNKGSMENNVKFFWIFSEKNVILLIGLEADIELCGASVKISFHAFRYGITKEGGSQWLTYISEL